MQKCPKCRDTRHVKNGIVRNKQRYKCKGCGCNYTQSSLSRTPLSERIQCIELYLEGVGFRGIERLTGKSHVSVMRWVRKLGDRIEDFKKCDKKTVKEAESVSIMELDEMWHFIQKKKDKCWIWLAYDRDGRRVCGFELGARDTENCKKLWNQLEMFDILQVCTDAYRAYAAVIPEELHIVTKAETSAVEALNSRIRHYLARFKRKTFCYSKAIHMVKATLNLFFETNWKQFIY